VAPKGQSTRPTADRTRQAVFNILEHAPWSAGLAGRRVIDLFSGSGALGVEALSRGATFCLFVETDQGALAAIRRNLEALGLSDRSRVDRRDATALAPRAASDEPFDIAFLDPPYGKGMGEKALAHLASGNWLAAGALVVLERGAGEAGLVAPGFEALDLRDYGAARVHFLRAP